MSLFNVKMTLFALPMGNIRNSIKKTKKKSKKYWKLITLMKTALQWKLDMGFKMDIKKKYKIVRIIYFLLKCQILKTLEKELVRKKSLSPKLSSIKSQRLMSTQNKSLSKELFREVKLSVKNRLVNWILRKLWFIDAKELIWPSNS